MRTFEVRLDSKTVQVVKADEFVEDGSWFIFKTNGTEAARFAKAAVIGIMDSEARPGPTIA